MGMAKKFIQYEYFFSKLLYVSEMILKAYLKSPHWKEAVLQEISGHSEYLTSDYFKRYLNTTPRELRRNIRDLDRD